MLILSLIGTSDSLPNRDHLVQIYCVQTQAIQQYGLNLSQCLPPPLDNVEVEKTKPRVSHAWDGFTDLETVNTQQVHSSTSENAMNLPSYVHGLPEASVSNTEIKPNDLPSHNGFEHVHAAYLDPTGYVPGLLSIQDTFSVYQAAGKVDGMLLLPRRHCACRRHPKKLSTTQYPPAITAHFKPPNTSILPMSNNLERRTLPVFIPNRLFFFYSTETVQTIQVAIMVQRRIKVIGQG
ncbi:hypothetical protein KIW84_062696 [Lathyrus oleraceus]|uniref:Uncharacterized protein n=1 Tax=Pisum sativum TaxID=3888 RepID=A0A9D4W6I8_PEA|nr:hypothetical protein KIW84_062696 [Pisum sativum]